MADRPLVWLHGEIKTPPFSADGRSKVGYLLRQLQHGESLSMPMSRPMPSIGSACHELRISDVAAGVSWRVIYRLDSNAVVIADVFAKKTAKTPKSVIDVCRSRLARYDRNKE